MQNNNEKTKISEQSIVAEALRMKDEGKLLHQITAVFPEHEKEIKELFGVVAYLKSKKSDFEPSPALLSRVLENLGNIEMKKETVLDADKPNDAISKIFEDRAEIPENEKKPSRIIIGEDDEDFAENINVVLPSELSPKVKSFWVNQFAIYGSVTLVVAVIAVSAFYYGTWKEMLFPSSANISENTVVPEPLGTFEEELGKFFKLAESDIQFELGNINKEYADAEVVGGDSKAVINLANTYNENGF
jgi:hypothetical protein